MGCKDLLHLHATNTRSLWRALFRPLSPFLPFPDSLRSPPVLAPRILERAASCDFTQPNTSATLAPRYSSFVSVTAGSFVAPSEKIEFSVFFSFFFCPIPALIYGHFGEITACFRVRNEERAGPKEIPQIGNVFSRFFFQKFAPSLLSKFAKPCNKSRVM